MTGVTSAQSLVVRPAARLRGELTLPGPPLRFFSPGADGEVETTRRDHTPPPVLGADGDAIRAWLSSGVPQDDVDPEDGQAT